MLAQRLSRAKASRCNGLTRLCHRSSDGRWPSTERPSACITRDVTKVITRSQDPAAQLTIKKKHKIMLLKVYRFGPFFFFEIHFDNTGHSIYEQATKKQTLS